MNSPYIKNHDSPLKADGRFGRFSYLAWNFLISLITCVAVFLIILMFPALLQISPDTLSIGPLIIIGIIYIAVIYFNFIFSIRRLHDRNHSGWLSLLLFVPLINVFFALYLLFAAGNDDTNNYGPQRPTAGWESVLAWIYIILIIFALVVGIGATLIANSGSM